MNPAADGTLLFTDQRGYVADERRAGTSAPTRSTASRRRPRRPRSCAANVSPAATARPATSSPSPTTAPPASCPAPSPAPWSQVTPPGGRRRPDHGHRRLDHGQRAGRRLRQRPVDHGDLHDHAAGRLVDRRPTTGPTTSAWPARRSPTPRARPVPTGTLGTFLVETGKIAITKYGLIRNPSTDLWSGTIKLTNTGTSAFSGPIFVLFNLPGGRDPGERHRHLRRDAVPGGQRRQPGGRRDRQRHRHVQLQRRRRQLLDVVLPRLPGIVIRSEEQRKALS